METATTTTAAKLLSQSGQSVLELMMVLPLLLGLTMLMIRVNEAIQMSIVNQKYARAQTLALSGNSSLYPLRSLRADIPQALMDLQYNHIIIGVSESAIGETDGSAEASIVNILPSYKGSGNEERDVAPGGNRSQVRVRANVVFCTPLNVINGKPVVDLKAPARTSSGGRSLSGMLENDPKQFRYCQGPLEMEQ